MSILIKRYANRKLYNTETSRYITLKGIAELLEEGKDVRVVDNESGEDITGVTLSQILVDTERGGREISGNLLSGIFQRGGDVLYSAIRRGVGDASESLDEIQRGMRRLVQGEDGGPGDWIAFSPKDLERTLQGVLERVFKVLDLPRRSDIEALNTRLSDLAEKLSALESSREADTPDSEES
jgi:polyhydroxyalkanoate synthesis repressor PhaR